MCSTTTQLTPFLGLQFICDWPYNPPDNVWALLRRLQLSGFPMSGCLSCSQNQISDEERFGPDPTVVITGYLSFVSNHFVDRCSPFLFQRSRLSHNAFSVAISS
ncbi:hypothetical protein LIER_26499 [Lithospermum erythrorhizon]|uniref:Uncharacterized protein n=1 Tax=Lithospermum erythrorhizon TaxID=34254 RepID=A0AAV3RBZ1_LITER